MNPKKNCHGVNPLPLLVLRKCQFLKDNELAVVRTDSWHEQKNILSDALVLRFLDIGSETPPI